VAYVIDRLRRAGTESQLLALVQSLDRDLVQPHVWLLDGEDESSRALEPCGCPVSRLGVRCFRSTGAARALWRFVGYLRRERVDVVHTFFVDSSWFGLLAAWLAGTPRVVRTRNHLGEQESRQARTFGRWLGPWFDATVVNCQPCRVSAIDDLRVRAERVVILENGVDASTFDAPSVRADPPAGHRPRVGMVGNLRKVKGPDLFVEAAALLAQEYPTAQFVVAGEGEMRPQLECRIRELKLDEQMRLAGSVTNVPEFVAELDVAVLPSRSEGQSNAILEYMAASRPIVASRVGGTPELIEDDECGLLVEAGDARGLAAAIGRLLSDRNLAVRLGREARRRVVNRFSHTARADRFAQFYRRILAGHADLEDVEPRTPA
jgi:glycosyltransferase involved in cell wall biosynthesis